MNPTAVGDSQPKGGQEKVNYALLSTTTLGRVRGFSIELLFMLHEGGGRCCDLSERSGKSQPYVHRYLRNLRKYELVRQNDAFWFLTEFGAEFVKYLHIVYNNIIEYRKKKERKKKEERKLEESSPPKVLKQVAISLWLQDSDRSRVEKEVVEVLVKHYNETGSKFLYFRDVYHFADNFKIRPDEVNQLLMSLKQDRIVYSFRDKQHNAWKVGLYKAFLEGLKASQGIT